MFCGLRNRTLLYEQVLNFLHLEVDESMKQCVNRIWIVSF